MNIDAAYKALKAFPSNGKPPRDVVTAALEATGLIASHEAMKQCSACGAKRVDYHYMKVTQAGRHFMLAYEGGGV